MNELPERDLLEARTQFSSQGACCIRGAFDADWLTRVAEGLEECAAHPSRLAKTWVGENNQGRFFQDGFAWERFEPLRQFVFESPAARIVSSLMSSRSVNLYMDHILMREAKTDKPTPWHHDTPYCFVDGRDFCTIWLPLDPIPSGEGLRLISGSHRWGKMFLPVEFGNSNAYARENDIETDYEIVPDIDAAPDKYEILSWDVEVGDCVVFYCSMLHSATGNRVESARRRVYSTRWVGDDAKYGLRAWSVPPLPRDPGLNPGDPFSGGLFPKVI